MEKIGNELYSFYIMGAPAVKKNSQTFAGGRRPVLIKSKAYQLYELEAIRHLEQQERPSKPIDFPIVIVYFFYRSSKGRADISNLYEAPQDIMQEVGIISDDNSDIIIGHDWSRVFYDKNNPRTEIRIYRYDDNYWESVLELAKHEGIYPNN